VPYRKRRVSQAAPWRLLLIALPAAALLCFLALRAMQEFPQDRALHHSPIVSTREDSASLSSPRSESSLPRRADVSGERSPRYYPYSVIAGGAHNVGELKAATEQDSVVRRHYSDFNLSRARTIRLETAKAVYVSYRLNGAVYWTKRKVSLTKGEEIITDGVHSARTRCGNRISDVPMQKTSPLEPLASELETALLLPSSGPILGSESSAVPPAVIAQGGAPPFFIPPIIFPLGSGSSSGSGSNPNPPGGGPGPTPPPPPPAPTPEVPTLAGVATGVLALLGYRCFRRNRLQPDRRN
jgi:hypothetical protein